MAAAGLSLVMMMGASEIAVSLPFAGMLAWTPIVLLAAAGYLLPKTVNDPTEAANLAVQMENDTAVAWRAGVHGPTFVEPA